MQFEAGTRLEKFIVLETGRKGVKKYLLTSEKGATRLKTFISWIVDYKELLFSGAGVAVVAGVVRLFFKKTCASHSQTIRSGDSSTNVQAGRDVNIGTKKKGNDVE